YFERLKGLDPEVISFDSSKFRTDNDWIRAGEIVFDSPTDYDISGSPVQFRDPSYYTSNGIPVAADGTVPFRQGNFPFDRTSPTEVPDDALPVIRRLIKMLYGVPWLGTRDPFRQFDAMPYREIVEYAKTIPPGVQARHGTGLQIAAQIPDLVMPVSVGTDPDLALKTRRGTGYYKVPSIRGVWYRGPFEHNGSVATLEDWFDSGRLRDDYVPTGFKGYGVAARPVNGHELGLRLSPEDKAALIAFLKTL